MVRRVSVTFFPRYIGSTKSRNVKKGREGATEIYGGRAVLRKKCKCPGAQGTAGKSVLLEQE